MRTGLKVALATAAFGAVHSALASTTAKEAFGRRVRYGRELYRVLYNAQAVVAFGGLVWYIARCPKQTIYRVGGVGAGLLRIAQWSGVVLAAAAAGATGVARLAGTDNLMAVLLGREPGPVPAAQGPEEDEHGELRIRGPFRVVRHPLNLAPLAPFWLTPHMTTTRLAFNLVATAYFVIGSIHEEKRLVRQYGERYRQYRDGEVPFLIPRIRAPRSPASRGRTR